jgi:hypothetical protein
MCEVSVTTPPYFDTYFNSHNKCMHVKIAGFSRIFGAGHVYIYEEIAPNGEGCFLLQYKQPEIVDQLARVDITVLLKNTIRFLSSLHIQNSGTHVKGKGNLDPVLLTDHYAMKGILGEWRYSSTHS